MPQALKAELYLKGRLLKVFTFSHDAIAIGRDPNADIFIDNGSVSWEHSRIFLKGPSVLVQDLGSANGTFLNEKRIEQAPVNQGDSIGVGKFTIKIDFNVDESAANFAMHQSRLAQQAPMIPSRTVHLSPQEIQTMRDATAKLQKPKIMQEPVVLPTAKAPSWLPWALVVVLAAILGGVAIKLLAT
ncbi:MAG: FHA domain-containing protein [Myxococcales bacterium]|nr:MAG: FHA domain-containing protein [Myxococcales bacterium]